MLWIKEVEMVESVDDLKSSLSVRGTQGPYFEVLDAKIASALNRVIQNTRFKKKEMKAAPHIMEQEVGSSRVFWNMRRRTRLATMEYVIQNSCVLKDHRGPWPRCICNHTCFLHAEF